MEDDTDPEEADEANTADADVALLLKMRQQLDAQLKELGVEAAPKKKAEKPVRVGRFATYARKKGVTNPRVVGADVACKTPQAPLQRSTVGQVYEVVYKAVPVREFPCMTARIFRSMRQGSLVELFEWDHTRQWRRCVVQRAVDSEELGHQSWRWRPTIVGGIVLEDVTGVPSWRDQMREALLPGTVKSDGWMRIEHETLGVLLQAVVKGASGQEENDAMVASVGPVQDVQAAARQRAERQRLEEEVLATVPDDPQLDAQLDPQRSEPKMNRAIRAGSYIVVRNMITDFEPVDKINVLGETALMKASQMGRNDIVGLLLLCMAAPHFKAKNGCTASDMAADDATRALLGRWQGQDVKDLPLRVALSQLESEDKQRIMERCNISEAAAEEHIEQTVEQTSDVLLEHLRPVRYRVVYKGRLTVREEPSSAAKTLRVYKFGDEVDMFEWDATRQWRRVRVVVAQENTDDRSGPSTEVKDGWMVLAHPERGVLLEEVLPDAEAENEEEDDLI